MLFSGRHNVAKFDAFYYADEKLRAVLLSMVSTGGTLQDKLASAYESDLRHLHERYFPIGDLRDKFNQIMATIRKWSPGKSSVKDIAAGIGQIDDAAVLAIIEDLKTLTIQVADHLAVLSPFKTEIDVKTHIPHPFDDNLRGIIGSH